MNRFIRLLLTVVLGIVCLPATAQSCVDKESAAYFFGLSIPAPDNSAWITGNRCPNTAPGVFDLVNEASFRQIMPDYESTSYIFSHFHVNGVKVNITNGIFCFDCGGMGIYPNPNSATAIQAIISNPQNTYAILRDFDGGSRERSLQLLVDYLKHNKSIQKWSAQYQAEETPNSPITGSSGLIPATVTTGYDSAMENTLSEIAGNGAGAPTPMNFAASYGHMRSGGKSADVTSLPLSHTWRSTSNAGRIFSLSGSLAHIKLAGATTWQGDFGAAFRLPVTERWALTPSLRYTGSHSDDTITATGLISVGLSSTYHIPFRRLDFVLGNMVGYHKTTDVIDLGKYTYNPNITSWSSRNGIMLAQPVNFFMVPLSLEYSLADTRYFGGTPFFVDNTQEVGVSIGTNRRANVSKRFFRVGLRYLHGRETNGVTLMGGYWF